MEFHRLTPAFYARYKACPEILTKEDRPYYVLLLTIDSLTYAIPLRSHIHHSYCFAAREEAGEKSGLDFSKAVVIDDDTAYVDQSPVTIRQEEFDVLKTQEYQIKVQFSAYVAEYKKQTLRRQKNPGLPVKGLCKYSALQYFHKELGLLDSDREAR
jgi:protein AbiQ